MKKVRIEGEFERFDDLANALHVLKSWAANQAERPDEQLPTAVLGECLTARLTARITDTTKVE